MTREDFYFVKNEIHRAISPLLETISGLEARVAKLEEEREDHDRQHANEAYVKATEGF